MGYKGETMLENMNGTTINSNATISFALAYGELVFGSVVILIIAVLGIIGNFMIIWSVILSKKLRTSTNAFVVSLSVADLLTCLFMPWYVVALLGKNGWALPNAEWLCGVTAFIIFTSTGVGLYNLAGIAINRLIYLTQSFKYRTIYRPWVVAVMIASTWLLPGGSLAILVISGLGTFGYETVDYPSCSDLDDVPNADIFNIAQTAIAFPLPMIIIVICYTWIYIHIRRHFMRKKAREAELGNLQNPSELQVSMRKQHTDEISKQELQITKNLFLVVVSFFVCFLVFFIANAFSNAGHFVFYAALPTFGNKAINFFIYASRHPQFKIVFRCMLTRRYSDIPEPSNLLKHFKSVSMTTSSSSSNSL